jgi:Uma2 family endonuclease
MSGVDTANLTELNPDPGQPLYWVAEALWPLQGQWSERDFLRLAGQTHRRIELAGGCVKVLPMPTLKHQEINYWFVEQLKRFVTGAKLGRVVIAGYPLRLNAGGFRMPDAIFVSAAKTDQMTDQFTPVADLVMEVVSQDRNRDYVEKMKDYAASGIAEYWIVDDQEQQVIVFVLQDGAYVEHARAGRGQRAVSKLLGGFEVDVNGVLDAGNVG